MRGLLGKHAGGTVGGTNGAVERIEIHRHKALWIIALAREESLLTQPGKCCRIGQPELGRGELGLRAPPEDALPVEGDAVAEKDDRLVDFRQDVIKGPKEVIGLFDWPSLLITVACGVDVLLFRIEDWTDEAGRKGEVRSQDVE